jgi:hypothetical protein
MLRAPICKLSPETLADILICTCDDVSLPNAHAVEFDRHLMLVCKRWYHTARSTPRLWNALKYDLSKRQAPDFLIKHWWESLSGGCPLHLILHWCLSERVDNLELMWESVVRPNIHRLQRVILSPRLPSRLPPESQQLLSDIWIDLSNSVSLTHIELDGYPIPPVFDIENTDNVSKFPCAPNLQCLAIRGNCQDCSIPHMQSNTLVHLVVGSGRYMFRFNQLWNLLVECPNLKALTLLDPVNVISSTLHFPRRSLLPNNYSQISKP